VYNKLDQMMANGIIVPVTEPTDWVSRILVMSESFSILPISTKQISDHIFGSDCQTTVF
jgi:hypothetical protein